MMEEANRVFKRWFAHLLFFSVLALVLAMSYLIHPLQDLKRPAFGAKEELVVCSSERTEFMDCVLSLFEEKHQIPVKLVTGENEELITMLKDGEGMPFADVLMGVSPLELYGNESLFQRYVSKNHQYISVPYQQEDDYSTAYLLSGNCIAVNKTLARDIGITGYADLLKPELTCRVSMSDPYYSMMGLSHMINILEIAGGYNGDAAWDFYKSLLEQSKVQLSAEEVYSGVVKGKYVAGLAYDEVCAGLILEGADIAIVYPVEGSLFMTKNAVILNHAQHRELAELFIDFLISKDMQDIFGTVLTARPVRIVAQISGYLGSKESIPSVLPDFESYSKSKNELKKRYRESLLEVSENE